MHIGGYLENNFARCAYSERAVGFIASQFLKFISPSADISLSHTISKSICINGSSNNNNNKRRRHDAEES